MPGEAAIASLTIFHLGRMIMTETALDGPALEHHPETERFESSDRALIEECLMRLERALPQPTEDVCDARWGLVFCDASGARVKTFYLDKFGEIGILDGATVEISDPSFIEWLRERYGEDSVLI